MNLSNRESVDIIIVTMDNPELLTSCVSSMLVTRDHWPFRIIIVNNGKMDLSNLLSQFKTNDVITILNPGKNLGWTGGLKLGLEHSKAKYVMFANDDIFIPVSSMMWLSQLVNELIAWPKIGAVGPSSNVVMGKQNIFHDPGCTAAMTTFLIGFCMLTRRSTLDEIGGVDETFPTGDDIDLSIRFLKNGYFLVTNRKSFVFHHGFQTGIKLYGGPEKPGGWNSPKMVDDTNKHLIQKHGFIAWRNTMCLSLRDGWLKDSDVKTFRDHNPNMGLESNVVLSSVNGCDPSEILEIGCGGVKTVEGSVGLDKEIAGVHIPCSDKDSVADIVADAQDPLPLNGKKFKIIIARHVLEHCVDVVSALRNWSDALEDDGVMIISVPDESLANTIALNSEHVHAFTAKSLTNIINAVGMKVTKTSEGYSTDSFTLEVKKKTQEESLVI